MMKSVDFLPQTYHRRREARRSVAWMLLVGTMFSVFLAAASLVQLGIRRTVEYRLDVVTRLHADAEITMWQKETLDREVYDALSVANLYMYLRHPWPRTQVLAEIIGPLPEEITLAELRITSEGPRTPLTRRRSGMHEEETGELESLQPAEADLREMRKTYDKRRQVAYVVGVTGDTSLLHSYVASLGHSELFADAQLISIERLSDNGKQTTEPGQSRFSVKLVMRGGYGQPTGPQASGDQVAAESNEGQGGAES
mgnify:CR=1 FL=1